VYPEVLSAPDLLRAIVESGVTEEKERRTSTIKAFLRHQYILDEEVQFKQVELQNRLLDLFVDVPISIRTENASKKKVYAFFRAASSTRSESNEPISLPMEHFDPEDYMRHHVHRRLRRHHRDGSH
jgi:hypothetical protein